ncbi:ParB N-terminal domain-containing protein [Streptomyces anthocyanicus]|uniref:ParB N-terminal domain-containing protein n=1 Tax=Streptomyces anthocyanicus TaxID=68174 RepID=UPI00365E9372
MTDQLTPPTYVEGDPRDLTLLDLNARFLPHEQFKQLVENIRRDGCLTSTPLVWNDADSGRRIVLSGNHRTMAAREAGLTRIGWLEITDPLPRQRQIALQLSHNAIAGQDDPAILKELYEELESVEWRQYTALDDKALELLEKVDVGGLGEANLDFTTISIVFLPDELERAEAALDEAKKPAAADARWGLALTQYDGVLNALETTRAAYKIGNAATAFGVILDTFERHLTDLTEGWYDPQARAASRDGTAPIETIFGVREIPTATAAALRKTIEDLVRAGDVPEDEPWRALDVWAGTAAGDDEE